MLDLRLAVVDAGGKNPMLAFVDDNGEVVTRIGPIPKRAHLVRQWLAEAYRCMGYAEVEQPVMMPVEPAVEQPVVMPVEPAASVSGDAADVLVPRS
jgi:hypothetical protein